MRGSLNDFHEGWVYIATSPWLWVTIVLAAFANVPITGTISVVMPKLVTFTYHIGIWLLGPFSTAFALGSIAGSLLIVQWKNLRRRGMLAYLGTTATGVALIIIGLPHPPGSNAIITVAAGALAGVGLGVFSVIWSTVMQELVPSEKLGRVFSVDALGSFALLPIGYSTMGILTDSFGPSTVILISGISVVCLHLLGLCVPGVRHLE